MDNFFSIITVVLNAREDLAKTIQSLKEQSFKKFEYIVIDGNSTDGSKELIERNKDFISNYLIENDNGIYDAMNKGLKISKGKYVGFINAGDKYTPNALNIIHKYLKSNNEVDFIFGTVKKKILKHGFKKNRIFWNFDFYTSHSSGFFINSESQRKLGFYNTEYKISADYDLFYRMIVKEKMKGISTLKDELIGIFKSGTSYSSKFTFIEHLFEETTIRKKNGQNIIIIFLVFLIHFFKNIKKIKNENRFRLIGKGINLIFRKN